MWTPIALTICMASPVNGHVKCEEVEYENADQHSAPTEHTCEALLRDAAVMVLGKASSGGEIVPLVSLEAKCEEHEGDPV